MGHVAMSRIIPRHIDVVVSSFGGVGTTFLTSFISKYKNTNHPADIDGLKHLPIPPVSFNPNIRFIYIYGDPILAAISLFRRHYQYPHSRKLQQYKNASVRPIPKNMSLEQYASDGVDRFLFRSHFYNWYEHYLFHPTIFIRLDQLWSNVELLIKFLGLPKSAVNEFPEKRKRSSDLNEVPQETIKGLQMLYGSFSNELKTLNDVEIRGDSKHKKADIFGSKNFRIALTSGLGYHIKHQLSRYLHNYYNKLTYSSKISK